MRRPRRTETVTELVTDGGVTRCADAVEVPARHADSDWRPRAPYGSRRLTTDLPELDVAAIARAALRGLPGAGGDLDVDGRRLVLSGGPALEIREVRLPWGAPRYLVTCPGCGRCAAKLYLDAPGLRCRVCARLTLPSCRNRTEDRALPMALARLARAREAIGADPAPGAPLPERRKLWSRWAWERRLASIREAEAALQRALDAAVARGRSKLVALSEAAGRAAEAGVGGASRDGGSRGSDAGSCQEKSTKRGRKPAKGARQV